MIEAHLIRLAAKFTGIDFNSVCGSQTLQGQLIDVICRSVDMAWGPDELIAKFRPRYNNVCIVESEDGLPTFALVLGGRPLLPGDEQFSSFNLMERLQIQLDNTRFVLS